MGLWSFCFNTTGGRVPEFPLQQLQEAIETRDGSKALKVLRKRRIRSELAHSTTTHKVPSGPDQKKCNVFTCVETAVHYQMPHVVIAMYRFNPADVRLATWFALHRLSRPKAGQSSNPEVKIAKELVDLARAQRKAWLWDQVGAFALLRCGNALPTRTQQQKATRAHPVANLPDEVFSLILSFVNLHEDREARILQFLIEARPCSICTRLCIPGKCKAKRLRRLERRASKRLSKS